VEPAPGQVVERGFEAVVDLYPEQAGAVESVEQRLAQVEVAVAPILNHHAEPGL